MKYCAEYAALLDLYVDGELPAEEMIRVQEHLDVCPGCQAYVDDALMMRAAFPGVEETEVPEGFCEDVMARVRASAPAERGKKVISCRRWARVLAPLAACCALVIVLKSVPGAGGGMDNGKTAVSSSSVVDAPAPASAGGTDVPAGEEPPADYSADKECTPMEDAAVVEEDEAGYSQTPAEAAEPRMSKTGGASGGGAAKSSAEVQGTAEPPAAVQGTAGGAAAPMLMMPAEMPSASESAPEVPENETELDENQENAMRKYEVALTLTEEEAGGLLDGCTVLEEETGVRRYELTRDEYAALLAALGLNGGTEMKEDAAETVVVEVRAEP